jgi:hypothetical protein
MHSYQKPRRACICHRSCDFSLNLDPNTVYPVNAGAVHNPAVHKRRLDTCDEAEVITIAQIGGYSRAIAVAATMRSATPGPR